MPEVILYIAASLDGYIARHDGAVDWLDAIWEPDADADGRPGPAADYGYADFVAGVGAVLMGRATYEQIRSFGGDYPYPGTEGYVFSRARAGERDEYVHFVDGADIPGLVSRLKAAQDKNIWLVGGGQLIREFLRLDLIDRIELFILPVILGDGIPLFPPATPQRRLALVNCQSYPGGAVQLSYRRAG